MTKSIPLSLGDHAACCLGAGVLHQDEDSRTSYLYDHVVLCCYLHRWRFLISEDEIQEGAEQFTWRDSQEENFDCVTPMCAHMCVAFPSSSYLVLSCAQLPRTLCTPGQTGSVEWDLYPLCHIMPDHACIPVKSSYPHQLHI